MSTPDNIATHLMRWQKALAGRQRLTRDMWIDRLVAANKSWSPDDLEVFWGQDREPSNYPILHTVLESVCGLEAQTRRDSNILARVSAHIDTAEALTAINKYVDQQAKADYVRSRAFRNAVTEGVGWTETYYSEDPLAETIGKRTVDPMHVWCDPAGREDDLSDYQDIFRARWLPKAWVEMRFKRARNGGGQYSPIFQYDPLSHTQNYFDKHGDEPPVALFNGGAVGDANYAPGHGMRAPSVGYGWATQDADAVMRTDRYSELNLLVERWYRADEWANFVTLRDGRVIECLPETASVWAPLLLAGKGKATHAIAKRIRCAIFVADGNGGLLQDVASPYPHGQFPFTPTWCYRDEEGQPMGIVRLLRDAAREFNMRRTHLTKRTLMRQVWDEEGAFVDDQDAVNNIAKYNGRVRINPGMMEKVKVVDNAGANAGASQLEAELLKGALAMVQNIGPVNQEALGQQTNAISGVAAESRKQASQTALFSLFDNRNYAQQCETEQTLALIQDSYTEEKEIRITGSSSGLQYLQVNQQDPTTGAVLNDISQGRYDCIIEEQPESSTVRAEKMQAVGQLFQGIDLPPPLRIQLAITMAQAQDLPVEVMDMLNKALQMSQQPQPPQPPPVQQRKTFMDILKIGLPDLTDSERAQALQQIGIQPDPQGPPPDPSAQQPQPPPQVSPDAQLKAQTSLAVQQSKNQHEAIQSAAERHHDLTTLAAQQAHDHTGRLMTAQEAANVRAETMARSYHERQAAAAHAQFDAQNAQMTAGTQAGLGELAAQNQHLRDAGLLAQQHQQGLEMAQHQADLAPPPPQGGGFD